MKTYWDLTKQERSELSDEEFGRHCAIELMHQGVTEPEPVSVEKLPTPNLLGQLMHEFGGICFASDADLLKFLALNPQKVMTFHDNHYNILGRYTENIRAEDFRPEKFSDKADLERAREELMRIREHNLEVERAEQEYRSQQRKVDDTLARIREDRQDARAWADKMQQIRDTLDLYVDLANGDENMAMLFLRRSERFTDQEIEEATT